MSIFTLDHEMIRQSIQLLHADGELFEIRLLSGKGFNASGYFTSADTAIKALQNFQPGWNRSTPTAKTANIFITLNPVDIACYSRQQRDMFVEKATPTTADKEVTALHWLLIDLDPVRMSGVSSSERELALAKDKARTIYGHLHSRGWQQPIMAMSGNGMHLVYRIDLPNTPANVRLLEQVLKCLSDKFSDEHVKVDTSVFNPARICKLWGTIAQKGATSPERPHRKAVVLPSTPPTINVNTFDCITTLVAELTPTTTAEPADNKPKNDNHTSKSKSKFDLQNFISRYNIPVRFVEHTPNGSTKYVLEHCLFDQNHRNKDAAIFEQADGTIGYKCFHDSCSDRHWKDVRLMYEPDAYAKRGRPPKAKKQSDYDIDGTGMLTAVNLQHYMQTQDYTVSYDVIKHSLIYSGFVGKSQEHLLEIVPTILVDALKPELDGCTESRMASLLFLLATDNKVNPILDSIRAVEWDGTDRLEEIYQMFKITPEDKLSRFLIEYWLRQCICGLMNTNANKPYSLDNILVFKGKQGIGKTRFFEHIAMFPKYFGEGVCIDPRDKDSIIQATSNWICELGEIGSTMKKDMDSVKALLSKAQDEYRMPYGRAYLKLPRMTSFVGTVNDEQFLIDQTGNRRFHTVALADDLYIDYATQIRPFNALQLWAQIYKIIMDERAAGKQWDECFRLPRSVHEVLEQRNEGFTKPMKGEDEVRDILARLAIDRHSSATGYYVTDEFMTVTEFINLHPELARYNSRQIGKVLTKLGHDIVAKKMNGISVHGRILPRKVYQNNN